MSENKTKRIVFMGTPEFAVPSLQRLIDEDYQVVAVVTQPDRPKGRKRVLVPPPVKVTALANNLPVLQPERLKHSDAIAQLSDLAPDLIVTAAYGQILPKTVLSIPPLGCINVHASLLPKYRGGAPIHHAIMNGETKTGVTIMYMAEGLDTGDMISQVEEPIDPQDTTGTLYQRLATAGAELLLHTLPQLFSHAVQRTVQDHAQATYAPNIRREDERIDWRQDAKRIYDQVRGLHPEPIAYTTLDSQVWKVWECEQLESSKLDKTVRSGTLPGTLLHCGDEGLDIQTGQGVIRITTIQPPGKKAMSVKELLRGRTLPAGVRFGEDAHE